MKGVYGFLISYKKQMKELNEKEVKEISLDILKFITDKCKKLNLKYVLIWGTLIGAIRHKGFIPWDDDIDIAMPREDYEILIQNMIEENDPVYSLVSIYNKKDYYYLVSRVVNNKTIIKLNKKSNKNQMDHGIFVDIYPIDKCGIGFCEAVKFFNKQMRLETFRTMALSKSFIKSRDSLLKTFVKYPFYLFSKIKGYKYFQNSLELNAKISNNKISNYYCCWCGTGGMNAEKLIFDRDIFNEIIEWKFENYIFMIPKEYDYILKQVYGNYMKLPPKDKQIGHHNYKAYYL